MIKIYENDIFDNVYDNMEVIGTLMTNLFKDIDDVTGGKYRKTISDYSDDGYIEFDDKLYQDYKWLFDKYKRMFVKLLGSDKYIIDRNANGYHIFGVDYGKADWK